MKNSKILGVLIASIVICIWGITFVCTKSLLNDFSSFEILFVRYFLAYLVLWLFYPHKIQLNDKSQELLFALAGLFGVTIYQLMENIAIHYTNASNVSIIVSICPMFTAIISEIFLKEKCITKRFIIGFIIAIIGVVLVSFNGVVEFNLNPKGDFLALIAGISWGFYSMFISRINKFGYNIIGTTRKVFGYSVLFMIPLLLLGIFIPGFKDVSMNVNLAGKINAQRFTSLLNISNLLFLAVLASSLCFVLWNKACKTLGTVTTTIGIYLIPVTTFIFAFIFLGEKFSAMGIIGAIFTLGGVIISSI